MAFWRPGTMDSWNPLSMSFWSFKNLLGKSGLESIRSEWRNQLMQNIPDLAKDPITSEPLTDIVITPFGDCFNRETLAKHWAYQLEQGKSIDEFTCPFTNQPLKADDLISQYQTDKIQTIFDELKWDRDKLLNRIGKMTKENVDDMRKSLEIFQNKMNDNLQKFSGVLKDIKDVALTKEHLKLNISKSEHLQYWNNTQTGMLKKFNTVLGNVTEVKSQDGEVYQIPKSIYDLMTTVKNEYISKERLLDKMKSISDREKLKFFNIRSESEIKILNDNIDSVDLRKKR